MIAARADARASREIPFMQIPRFLGDEHETISSGVQMAVCRKLWIAQLFCRTGGQGGPGGGEAEEQCGGSTAEDGKECGG